MKEDALQEAIFEWLSFQQVEGIQWIHSVPCGGWRPGKLAGLYKRTGLKKGILDIFFPKKTEKYSGFMCEVKVGKNKPTKEQKEYAAWCLSQGFYTCLVYSLDDFEKHFNNFIRTI